MRVLPGMKYVRQSLPVSSPPALYRTILNRGSGDRGMGLTGKSQVLWP